MDIAWTSMPLSLEVIKKDKAPGSKAALVYGQMNEPPGARARVALTGLTVAEYFRDEEGQARRGQKAALLMKAWPYREIYVIYIYLLSICIC